MSKPTARELIERAFEREAGVVLAARVEEVLALLRDGPADCRDGYFDGERILRRLNGLDE